MVKRPKIIIGTPFKSINGGEARRTNKRIRELSARIQLSKRNIRVRKLRDTIEARGLPRPERPGAIE